MSFTSIEMSVTQTSSRTTYATGSMRPAQQPVLSPNISGSRAKITRKKICFNILDNFTIDPVGFGDIVHYVYDNKVLASLAKYANLIHLTFPKSGLGLQLFEDKVAGYSSIFVTIYPSKQYKSIERRYLGLLDRVSKSNFYMPSLDIDYKQLNG